MGGEVGGCGFGGGGGGGVIWRGLESIVLESWCRFVMRITWRSGYERVDTNSTALSATALAHVF